MSSSLLKEHVFSVDNGETTNDKKSSTILYSMKMLNLEIGTLGLGSKDALQVATLKAVCKEPGLPKKKHLITLGEALQSNTEVWENILICVDALSHWRKSRSTSCKTFVTILYLLQNGAPVVSGADCDVLKIFVSSVSDHWENADQFLSIFGMYLRQRLSFLEEYPQYNRHFNRNSMSTNGLSLPPHEHDTLLTILSRLLNAQSQITTLLRIPFNIDATAELTRDELMTYKCALTLLYEDAYAIYVALTQMLLFVQANRSDHSPDVIDAFVSQYIDLFMSLSRAYSQITAADGDTELSKLPEHNPLVSSKS